MTVRLARAAPPAGRSNSPHVDLGLVVDGGRLAAVVGTNPSEDTITVTVYRGDDTHRLDILPDTDREQRLDLPADRPIRTRRGGRIDADKIVYERVYANPVRSSPVIVSWTVTEFLGSQTTSHNADYPATVDANDGLLTVIGSSGTSAHTHTTPSGHTVKGSSASGVLRTSEFIRVADGGEDGGTVNFQTSVASYMVVHMARIEAGSWAESTDGVEAANTSGTTGSPDPPNLAPSWGSADTMWLAVGAGDGITAVTGTPTDYSLESTDSADIVRIASRVLEASSENPGAFSGTPDDWMAATVAIEPAAPTTTPVNKDLELDWAVLDSIGDAVELDWTVLVAIGDAVELDWAVATPVGDPVDLDWAVRAVAGDEVEADWNVRDAAGDAIELIWPVASVIGDETDLQWAVAISVGDTVEFVWAVAALVGDKSDLQWGVLDSVGDAVALVWPVALAVGDPVDLDWAVLDAIGDSSDLRWAVRSAVGDESELDWAVRDSIGDTVEFIWDVAATGVVGDAVSLVWDVRDFATDSLELDWAVLDAIITASDLQWSVLDAIGDESVLEWAVRSLANDETALVWPVRDAIGDDITFIWDVLSGTAIGDTLSLVWGVRQAIGSAITLVWKSGKTVVITEIKQARSFRDQDRSSKARARTYNDSSRS